MIRRRLDTVLSGFLLILISLMLLQVIWQVVSRYLVGIPSSVTDELSRFLLIWIGVLGAGYITGKKMHLAIELLPGKLPPRARKRLEILIQVMIIVFAALVLITGGTRLVYITLMLGQTSSSLSIPMGYIYMVLPISGIVIILYCILNIIDTIKTSPAIGHH